MNMYFNPFALGNAFNVTQLPFLDNASEDLASLYIDNMVATDDFSDPEPHEAVDISEKTVLKEAAPETPSKGLNLFGLPDLAHNLLHPKKYVTAQGLLAKLISEPSRYYRSPILTALERLGYDSSWLVAQLSRYIVNANIYEYGVINFFGKNNQSPTALAKFRYALEIVDDIVPKADKANYFKSIFEEIFAKDAAFDNLIDRLTIEHSTLGEIDIFSEITSASGYGASCDQYMIKLNHIAPLYRSAYIANPRLDIPPSNHEIEIIFDASKPDQQPYQYNRDHPKGEVLFNLEHRDQQDTSHDGRHYRPIFGITQLLRFTIHGALDSAELLQIIEALPRKKQIYFCKTAKRYLSEYIDGINDNKEDLNDPVTTVAINLKIKFDLFHTKPK